MTVATTKGLKDAQKAITKAQLLKAEIDALMISSGISAKQEQMQALKAAATDWAVATETETIPLPDGGHAQLRRDKYGGMWIATKADLDGAPDGAVPLYDVLKKKFKKSARRKQVWFSVTRRIIDPVKLSAAVEEGVLALEDVENSFHEKEKKAYLRVYTGMGNGDEEA